jgi:hypothetical protein
MAFLMSHEFFRAGEREMICQPRIFRRRLREFFLRPALLLALLLTLGTATSRAQPVSREFALKAVFLFNFAQFTDWPTNAVENSDSPFVIGILGGDPFGALLDDAVRNEQVNGRKIIVRRFLRVEDVKTCHILFIAQSEARRLDKIITDLKGRPVLTVSDIENSAQPGVCVRFINEHNKIRLRINTDSLKEANLVMSSKLLRVAELVTTDKNQ